MYVDETEVSPTTTVEEIERLVESRLASGARETEIPTFPNWTLTGWGTAIRGAFQNLVAFPLMSSLNGSRVAGLEHVRSLHQPAIYAINHNVSRWDVFLLLKILPPAVRSRLTYAAAAEITFGSLWKGFLASLFANAFPLYRRFGVRTKPGAHGQAPRRGLEYRHLPRGSAEYRRRDTAVPGRHRPACRRVPRAGDSCPYLGERHGRSALAPDAASNGRRAADLHVRYVVLRRHRRASSRPSGPCSRPATGPGLPGTARARLAQKPSQWPIFPSATGAGFLFMLATR